MKQGNIKKDIKIVRKAKPSAKGAGLRSANKNLKPETQNLKQMSAQKLNIVSNFALRASDFKRWHKLSAAFVAIAIISTVIFFQFAPENVRSKTFYMIQSQWITGDTATKILNQGGDTTVTEYASKDVQISLSPDTAATLAATSGSNTQTSDANFNGTNSSTVVGGNSVKMALNVGSGGSAYSCTTGTCNLAGGTYTYSSFNVSAGAIVNITGTSALKINVTGNVTINGTLQANGGNGSNGSVGGVGGAGALGSGGNGGVDYHGNNGTGGASGKGGGGFYIDNAGDFFGGGGGGAGYYGSGGVGENAGGGDGAAGTTYAIGDINGGSGGGSGARQGGGGGGGGGAIKIIGAGVISVGSIGKITVNGGDGGKGTENLFEYGSWNRSGGGGGGSGGAIYLEAATITNGNATDGIQAKGGSGGTTCINGDAGCYDGGKGGGGRIELHAKTTPSTTGAVCTAGASGYGTAAGCTPVANTIMTVSYYTSGNYTSGAINTGQKSDFTTASWTASTTNTDTFTHTSDGDFNGTNSNTVVNSNSVKLDISFGTGADGSIDLSKGNTLNGGCTKDDNGNTRTGTSWSGSTCTIITNTKNTWNFTSIIIPSTYILTASGSNKITLYATGTVAVDGTINFNASGKTAIAGGGSGGNGGTCAPTAATAGQGVGPSGIGGGAAGGNGAGGGFGAAGTGSGAGSAYPATNPTIDVFYGGSGGGGGGAGGCGGDHPYSGSNGGGGGGAIRIMSGDLISIGSTGIVRVNGANGAGASNELDSGGGAGGGILLQAQNSITNSGSIQTKGGIRGSDNGGYGAGGRVRLETLTGSGITGTAVVTASCAGAVGSIDVCGGSTNYGTATSGTFNNITYKTPGAYTSVIKEIGTGEKFKSIAWTEILNGQTITMKVRTCNDAACSGESAFSTLSNIVNGQDYSASPPTGVTNGDGWIQYEASLSTANTAVTPTLDSVTITTIPLVLEARAGNVATPDGTWTAWSEIGSGATSSSSLGTTFDGNQYIQYRAKFSTVDTAYTPSLDDITFNYQYYPANTDYILTSSAFNSGDLVNIVNQIQWTESLPPTGTDVKFQVRTAPDNGSGSPDWTSVNASKWCGPTSCAATTGDTDYANSYYNTTPAGENLNGVHGTGSNAQWFQYKAFLSTTDSGNAPTLSDVTLRYVINASPVVSDVTAGAQDSTGKSTIQYTVYDPEEGSTDNRLEAYYLYDAGTTLSGALAASAVGTITLTNNTSGVLDKILTAGYLLIDNEVVQYDSRSAISGTGPYTATANIVTGGRGKWISGTAGYSTKDVLHNSGVAVLVPIPDSALSGATSPGLHIACSAASTCLTLGTAKTYTVTWDPNDHLNELYKSGMGVKVMVNDKNGANMVGSASGTRNIDTKAPVIGANPLIIDSGAATAVSRAVTLTLQNIADDSNLYIQFSNNYTNDANDANDTWGNAADGSGAVSGDKDTITNVGTYSKSWTLSVGNGAKTVYTRLIDIFGNPPALAGATIYSDSINFNTPPEFDASYTAGAGYATANGVSLSQLPIGEVSGKDGQIAIKFKIRDQDTTESAQNPAAGFVNVSFEYNSGAGWTSITGGLTDDAGDTFTSGVAATAVTSGFPVNPLTVYWNAKSAITNDYYSNFQIRATINDGETNVGNNTATASGAATGFNLDIKDPVLTGITFTAKDITDNSATVTDSRTVNLAVDSITENSSLDFQFANDANNNGSADDAWGNTSDASGVVTGGWDTVLPANLPYAKNSWVLNTGNGTKRVFIRIRDQFGNPAVFPTLGATATISYNIAPEINSDYDNNVSGYTCYGAGTNGTCIRQLTISDDAANAGKVAIKYQVRDQDTDESAVAPAAGNVNVFFKYSTNGGTNWSYVTGNLSGDGTDNGTNAETAALRTVSVATDGTTTFDTGWTTHTTYWDASSAVGENSFATPNFKIMAFVDDGEAVSNRNGAPATNGGLASGGTSLDTNAPALGLNVLIIDATGDGVADTATQTKSVQLKLQNITEDADLAVQFSNDNTTYGTTTNSSGSVTDSGTWKIITIGTYVADVTNWTLPAGNGSKTVYAKIKNIYGNPASPTAQTSAISYNITPEFNSAYDAGAGYSCDSTGTDGVCIRQITVTDDAPNAGKVAIKYQVRDQDTDESAVAPAAGNVNVYFQYSVNGGGVWSNIANNLSGDGSDNGLTGGALNRLVAVATDGTVTVDTGWTTHTTYWDAKTAGLDGNAYASPNFKIRAYVADGEAANNTSAALASDGIALDVKNPTGVSVSIDSAAATTTSRDVTLTLARTDDSSTQMQFANTNETTYGTAVNNDGTVTDAGTFENFGATKSWRAVKGVSTTKTVYFKVRDAYGNTTTASDTISYNQTPEFDGTFGTNGIDVYQCQITDTTPCDIGKVRIQYRIRDKDKLDGSANQSTVTALIEYYDGAAYQTATTLTGDTGNLAVETTSSDYPTYNPAYKTFATYWNAKTDFANQFKNGATNKIRITINDGESALNTTPATLSAQYVLDTKNPTLGGSPILINGNNPSTVVRASTLSLSSTDDNTLYSQYSNDNSNFGAATDSFGDLDNAQGSAASQVIGRYAAYGASKSWTLWTPKISNGGAVLSASATTIPLTTTTGLPASGWIKIENERIYYPSISGNNLTSVSRGQADTTAATHADGTAVEVDGMRTAYVKFFDIYGNGLAISSSSDSIIYDQTPAGVIHDVSIQDASNTATGNWRLFLSWRTLETALLTTDFKQYKIFRCKSGTLTDTNCPVALSSGIDAIVTTIPVNDTTTLAASGTIDIGGEIITYTGKTGTTLTGAIRGANNTTAASHSSGAQVYSQLTNLTAQTAVLSGGIADGTTMADITLNVVTGLASSGAILIDNEAISYTSITGTTLTGISRAQKGTAGAAHSSGAQVQSLDANLTTNFYTDNFSSTDSGNANPNQTKYFYFIRSEDLAGNLAPKSSIVSSVPNGSGGRDTIPVRVYDNVVSNCSVNTATGAGGLDNSPSSTAGLDCSIRGTNSATIKWKTYNNSTDVNTGDQDQGKGDSFVEYGTVSGTYTNSAGLHEYTASHSIALTGLQPNTTYYFRVRTRDGIGNIDTTKTDGTGGISLERSFTTRDIDTPTSISATPSKNGAAITWSTIDQTNSLIEYWKLSEQTVQTATCNYSNIVLNKVKVGGTENEAVTSHSISISQKLSTSSDYCFRVRSKDTNNNNITGSAIKFTTLAAPTISNARADSADIQTNTAIVKWSTSDNTTSYLEFWKTGTSGKKTAGGDTLATAHSVQLPDDLLPNTKYYFQIKSKDDADNAITSVNANCVQADGGGCYFTTNAPPAPGAISVANVGMNKAEISWTTTGGNDSKTNSIAEYVKEGESVWKIAGNDAQASSHNVALPTELAAGIKYFVRVRTRDGKGNSVNNIASVDTCPTGLGNGFDSAASECYFTTKIAPVISQVRVAESLKDKLTITWLTDVAATSIVEYGQNNTYGAIAGDDKTEATNHSVTVDGLTQKTAYHFKVRSFGNTAINQQITKVANLSETNDFTAETAIDPGDITAPVISQAAVGDTSSSSAVITWITDEPADSQVFYTSSNPQTAEANMKPETRNLKHSFVLGVEDTGFKIQDSAPIAHAASDTQPQVSGFKIQDSGSWFFTVRLTLSRSLAWTANHMPQVSLVVSFILGAVFAVFAALLLVMANYMRGGWKLRQILKMTPMIVLKDTSSGFCALANSDNQGTWQASFSVYSKHRNITRKTIGAAFALGALKIFLSTSIPVFLLTQASFAAVNYSSTERDAAMNTTHRVELSELNPATTYWVYASSADAKGNSANTIANPLSFTTETAPDETAPVISNIQITGITDSEAVIAWETDESGDSFVEYGIDTAYGSSSGQEEGKTSHSVKLAGLKGNTTYHFKAKSKDISGNIGQSIDQSFATSAGPTNIPPKISAEGPRVEDLKPISAKILWKTDKPSSSIVAFGKDTNYGTEIGNIEELITEHEVQLIGLDPDIKYHYKVKSADADGNIGESADKEFATPAKAVISKVAASEISMTSAIVAWETSTSITSEIEYGKTVAYGKNIIDKSLSQTTQHTVKIDGLESGVQYHFRAKGTDQYGSIVQSDDYAFSTIAEPKIAKFEIESVTHGGAEIVWETNTDTDSLVEYQKDGDADVKTAGATDLAKNHRVKIDKLEDNAKFRARIVGRDALGNEVKSDYKEFLTLADTEAPKITSVKTESSIPSSGEENVQVLVSWTTDEPGTSQVEYRQGVALGKNYPSKSRLDTNLTTSHLAVLSGFKTSDIYHFRVVSKDRAGNEGASADYTILTPQKKESLLQIILKNLEESFGFLRKLGK